MLSLYAYCALVIPDIVRDEEVNAWQPQRLAERQKLVGIKTDARAKRRLQQIPVGGGGRSPSDRAKVGCQDFGLVREAGPDVPPPVLIEHGGSGPGVAAPLAMEIIRDYERVTAIRAGRPPPRPATPHKPERVAHAGAP